jgi:ABC-type transporter Mla subunit MlaD
MGRILLLTALLYGYGDAGFDGHRPASFDRPLRNLHRAVDTVARDAQRILLTIDNKANVIATLPMLGEKLRRLGEALTPI